MDNQTGEESTLNKDLLVDTTLLSVLMRETISHGNAFRFRASGQSMRPFICPGDTLTISPLWGKPARLGDVIAFQLPHGDRLLVHRVIQNRYGTYRLRGDNSNQNDDGWIGSADIFGRVTRVERGENNIRLGLGWEKVLIAWLSRFGWLALARRLLGAIKRWLG